MKNLLVLTSDGWNATLAQIAEKAGAQCLMVVGREEFLKAASTLKFDYLVSFATGIIVPEKTVDQFSGRAYNIHPASPEYPGNFPHHFAVFDGVKSYGATAHIMTARVDDGPIVDVELAPVDPDIMPKELMQFAEAKGCIIFERLVQKLVQGIELEPLDLKWGEPKTNRRDFQALCNISPLDTPEIMQRKLKAVQVEGHQNAYIELHGERYVHQGPMDQTVLDANQRNWSQFTEEGYRNLLEIGKASYQFAHFTDNCQERHLIWRHDLDHSIERAHRIAKIENEHGVEATYMFVISLPYYNIFDGQVRAMARDIAAMGHRIGLHFNASAYETTNWTLSSLEAAMSEERDLLSKQFQTPVDCVSFHDPTNGNLIQFDNKVLAGMVNAYGAELRNNYGYCSDSNGYWRHKPIPDVLKHAEHHALQVLTHPEWWTETAKPPRNRIEEALLNQTRQTMNFYDQHIIESGRKNLTK